MDFKSIRKAKTRSFIKQPFDIVSSSYQLIIKLSTFVGYDSFPAPSRILQFSLQSPLLVFIKTNHRSHSINQVKNIGYDRSMIYKQLHQDFWSVRCFIRALRGEGHPYLYSLARRRHVAHVGAHQTEACHRVSLLKRSVFPLLVLHIKNFTKRRTLST